MCQRVEKFNYSLLRKWSTKGEGIIWHRASTWQEKKPPVTSGKETIDCVVYMRGNGSICRFSLSSQLFIFLVSTELLRKATDLPFLVFISGGKCPLFPRQARIKIAFVLVRCFFLSPLLLSSTMCIQTPYSSNFFASFSCVFTLRLLVLDSWALPEVCARPSASMRLTRCLVCVFDPETGWQLSLTAAWLNAQRSSHRGEKGGKKNLTSARLVPVTWIRTCFTLNPIRKQIIKHAKKGEKSVWRDIVLRENAQRGWGVGLIWAGGCIDNNRLLRSTADLVVASYVNKNLNEITNYSYGFFFSISYDQHCVWQQRLRQEASKY